MMIKIVIEIQKECLMQDLITCLDGMAIYACVPAHMQNVAVTLLQDDKWLDEVYFPTNIERLKNAFENTVSKLNQIGVSVFPAQVEKLSR